MKTGLNFYTTTIINSDKYVNGKSRFKADKKAAYIYPGMTFFKDGIQKIYYKEGYEGEMAKVEVDLAQLKPTAKIAAARRSVLRRRVSSTNIKLFERFQPNFFQLKW